MNRRKELIRRELRVSLVFLLLLFTIEVVPSAFSFSGKSPFYEKYYADASPITMTHILILIFFIRLLWVFIQYKIKERRHREKAQNAST